MAARVLTHIHSSRDFYSHLLLEWKVPSVCVCGLSWATQAPQIQTSRVRVAISQIPWYHWLTKDCILWIRFKMPKLCFQQFLYRITVLGEGVSSTNAMNSFKKARFLNRALSHVSHTPLSALLGLLPYLIRNTRHDYRPESLLRFLQRSPREISQVYSRNNC